MRPPPYPHDLLTCPLFVVVQQPLTSVLPKAVPPTLSLKPPPSISLAFVDTKSILALALPMVLTALLLYSRSMISMLFLGRLGDLLSPEAPSPSASLT
ncbi:hypothetical protein BHM03_00001350 [Ensete ventricosum]|uniref:Uncharacterized protein n=1 Tax=Ensete ventricosum TaxID=4639 RepID=A0A445M951_ENSVE|nr:hypothetical protein BHM03_00001350 [Ensete ventricosum]